MASTSHSVNESGREEKCQSQTGRRVQRTESAGVIKCIHVMMQSCTVACCNGLKGALDNIFIFTMETVTLCHVKRGHLVMIIT